MQEGKLVGLDIETACNVQGCIDKDCKHALDPHRSKITVIGITDGDNLKRVFRGSDKVQQLVKLLSEDSTVSFTAHNGKFDVKHLIVHGAPRDLMVARWLHDSSLLAFTHQDKIQQSWLDSYEATRRELNKTRRGNSHRNAGPHSLKTTAPYYLGVAPFWEAETYDNDEYVLKDAEYSLRLTNYMLAKLPEDSIRFYSQRYLPWTKNLLDAELAGIRLDIAATEAMQVEVAAKLTKLEAEIDELWAPHFRAWIEKQERELEAVYMEKAQKALGKSKQPAKTVLQKYDDMLAKAKSKLEPLNIGSPTQLTWLLRERLKLDPRGLDGSPSTDKEALELLSEQNADVRKLLEARKLKKLLTAFLPEYLDVQVNGRIHTNFNVTEARTGRLSSSNPNLQQVMSDLHKLFVADEDSKLVIFDLSAIEPTVLAYYSEDPQLCKLMIERGDFHSTNAYSMFNLECEISEVKKLYPKYRQIAKAVGLSVLYGAGANQVHRTLLQNGLHNFTIADAKAIVYRIRDLYAGVWNFKKELDSEMEKGSIIYNLLGRPIKIQDPQDAYMKSLNTLIQSSASDLLQDAAYKLKIWYGYQPILLVHDEVVFQIQDSVAAVAAEDIKKVMTSMKLDTKHGVVPIRLEGGVSKEWKK